MFQSTLPARREHRKSGENRRKQSHEKYGIVEYIVHNGLMKDLSVLQESPFTDQGHVVEIFTDVTVWMGIKKAIEKVNANALAA